MLDTYNQAVHEDVACTIRTNINTANHHFIMEKWYEDCIGKILKDKNNAKKLDGEPKIAEMPHGYFGGTITEISNAIKSASAQYNTIVLEPMDKIEVVGHKHKGQSGVVYGENGIAPTITTNKGDGQLLAEPMVGAMRGRNPDNPSERGTSNTLTGVQKDNYVIEPTYRIRKLTERECFRLMGVSEEDIDKLIYHSGFTVWNGKKYVQVPRISKSRLYKLAGNNIVVDVMVGIFEQLLIGNKNTNQQLEIF